MWNIWYTHTYQLKLQTNSIHRILIHYKLLYAQQSQYTFQLRCIFSWLNSHQHKMSCWIVSLNVYVLIVMLEVINIVELTDSNSIQVVGVSFNKIITTIFHNIWITHTHTHTFSVHQQSYDVFCEMVKSMHMNQMEIKCKHLRREFQVVLSIVVIIAFVFCRCEMYSCACGNNDSNFGGGEGDDKWAKITM